MVSLPQRSPEAPKILMKYRKPIIKSILEINPPKKIIIKDLTGDPGPGSSHIDSSPGPFYVDVLANAPRVFREVLKVDPPGLGGDPVPVDGLKSSGSVDLLGGPEVLRRPTAPAPETERKISKKHKVTRKNIETTSKDEDSEGWTTVNKKKKRLRKKKMEKMGINKEKGSSLEQGKVEKKKALIPTESRASEKTTMQLLQKRISIISYCN